MTSSSAWSGLLGALRDAIPVNPWLAGLWLASAIVLAILLVYVWQFLASRFS